MLGAVIGDIVGSRFEWKNIKSKEFELLTPSCRITDDSVMTFAVARAVLECEKERERLGDAAVAAMRDFGRRFARGCYGGRFSRWQRGGHARERLRLGGELSGRCAGHGKARHHGDA